MPKWNPSTDKMSVPSPQTKERNWRGREKKNNNIQSECSWLQCVHTLYAREVSGKVIFFFDAPKYEYIMKNWPRKKVISILIKQLYPTTICRVAAFCSALWFSSHFRINIKLGTEEGGGGFWCGGEVPSIASILHKYRSIHCINFRIVENCTSRASQTQRQQHQ